MLNTLGVRSTVGDANRRKLSFRNVSNVVVQLLHTIKPYSVPAPFSHLATAGSGFNSDSVGGFHDNTKRQVGFLSVTGRSIKTFLLTTFHPSECLQNKVTEKFKRPFKKRHSSVYHQPSNRVNKFLSQAIEVSFCRKRHHR